MKKYSFEIISLLYFVGLIVLPIVLIEETEINEQVLKGIFLFGVVSLGWFLAWFGERSIKKGK